MKIAIMQPYFLPYLGYFQLINAVDVFVIYDDVNFIKKGWINRNNILIDGQAHLWTLPLSETSQNRKINQHHIFEPQASKQKLLSLFVRAYQKAPFYQDILPLLEAIFSQNETQIDKFIHHSLSVLCDYMGIQTKFVYASDLPKDTSKTAEERIIDMVLELGGTHYYNAISGQELYDFNTFKKKGLDLFFIKMREIKYPQFSHDFVPFLSILDTLMFNSKDDIKKLLVAYDLIGADKNV